MAQGLFTANFRAWGSDATGSIMRKRKKNKKVDEKNIAARTVLIIK